MVLSIALWLVIAAADGWQTKRVADWTDAETKQVLTDSPWAFMVTPIVKKENRQPGNRSGGLGVGPVGVGGIGRHRSGGQQAQDPDVPKEEARPFNVRWESALPVREAELKARETNAPAVDEDHYAIAVYCLPSRVAKDPHATLKREGQKDIKPVHVDMIPREDGVVVVFLFPRTKEITGPIEFDAQIGPYQFTQVFHAEQMTYQGKIEL